MARIRSVKPEFWTDPDVVAVSSFARLLFIGCWNHADDYGVLKDDPRRLKLQVLPADDVDADDLVNELVAHRLLLRKVAPDGTRVLVIRTFCTHQRIDKRSPGQWGNPEDFDSPADPDDAPPIPTDPHDSQPDPTDPDLGLEGTGQEGNGSNPPPAATSLALVRPAVSPAATDDVERVFRMWIEATGRTSRTVLDSKRRRLITKALKDYPLDDVLDAVRGWQNSPHHCGETNGTVYNDLELLLRDPAHIEQFRGFWRSPPRAPRRETSVSRGLDNIRDVLLGGGRPAIGSGR